MKGTLRTFKRCSQQRTNFQTSFSFSPFTPKFCITKPQLLFSINKTNFSTQNAQTKIDFSDSKFERFRKELKNDLRYRISVRDYLNLAENNAINEDEAIGFLDKLKTDMLALTFKDAPNYIFIKPSELTNYMIDILDPEEKASKQAILFKQKQLEKLQSEKKMLDDKRALLDDKAESSTTRVMWLCVGGMVAQASIVGRLTWWELSWDIMEPVTYLLTYSTSIFALVYFGLTRNEYSYGSFRDRIVHKKKLKFYARNNFDLNYYQKLLKQIEQLNNDLKLLGVNA